MVIKNFKNLKKILSEIFLDIKKQKLKKNTILFSPAGASFDSFKNFEDRGFYFNKLVKKFVNGN
jgi:UDP-N-acetylmuramoylalanine--D-glutamate ligase